MAQQEKELGIKFNGEPNIQYFSKRDIPGTYYDGETNTLWIDVNDTVSPRNTPECIITRLLKPKADGADETIYHEMGHFYLRQLRMKNGIAQPRTDSEKFHAQRVEEGVAEYFERRMTKFDGFEPFRSGQWHMVKPIIDQYGERGMAFLISNLSKMDEPSEEYQKRAYQESVVKTALTANTLCVLPTGLGKTSVAALVAAERLSKNMKGKVLFLAPTRPLVNQHKMNFERFLKLGVELAVITGETKAEERFKIYKENDIIFATPQCVTGDTNIFVKDRGIVKIQEFVESFELKECKYGNKTGFCADVDEHTTGLENNKISDVKISHVWKLPANTLYEIKTELNNCIKCTPEHPLLTINTSGKIEWKMVEDLDTNTWVAMPKKIHMAEKIIDIYSLIRNSPLKISDKKFTHSLLEKHKKLGVKRGKISRFYHNDIDIGVFFELLDMCEVEYPGKIKITNKTGRSTPIIVSKFISPEMCYLIGAILCDGHIGDTKSKGNEVVFSAIADKDVLEKFRQYVIETFGIIPKLDSRKGLVYYSTAMAHVMNALGVPFGKKAGIIRVPNYIFGLPECHILKFIGSLFDTDGSASKHSINVVSTISKDFAEDVRWLLLRLGMVSYLHKSGRSETVIRAKKYKTHHIYNVVISGEAQINRFIELCEPDYRKIKKAVEGLSLIKRHGTRSKDIVPIQTALQEAYLDHRKFGGAPSNEILMAYHHKYLSTSSLSNLLIKMNSSKAREIENLLSLPIRWVRIKSKKKYILKLGST